MGLLLLLWSPIGILTPYPKFGSAVETDTAHMYQQGMKKFITSGKYNFLERAGQVPKKVPKWLEKAGRSDWLGVLQRLRGGVGLRIPSYGPDLVWSEVFVGTKGWTS